MADDSYDCADCGGTFTKGWSDEEADAEAFKNQGLRRGTPGTALLCDDCYREFVERITKKPAARAN